MSSLKFEISSSRMKAANFIAESCYLSSLQNKCEGLLLLWKADFSYSNRLIWRETLKYALRECLAGEANSEKIIDDDGLDRFVELVESAIFHYVARDHAEYGNAMGMKYDSIRGGDFPKEERVLLEQLAWL